MILSSEHIDVWTVNLRRTLSGGNSVLNVTRAEHLRSLQMAEDRRNEFLLMRTALRGLLGAALEVNPMEVAIEEDAYGKPKLTEDAPLRVWFNVAHSGDLGLLALTQCGPIGADIEAVGPLAEKVIGDQRLFSENEQNTIKGCEAAIQAHYATRTWVCKEAVAKAWGLGIQAFSAFSVRLDDNSAFVISQVPALRSIVLRELDVGQEYVAAVACLHTGTAAPCVRVHGGIAG